MRKVRTEIEIQVPAERVWQVLTDYAGWSEWNPLLYRAAGKATVGEKVEVAFQGPNDKEVCIQCTIVELEPQRTWMWKYHIISPILFRGEHSFTVEAVDSDRTRFSHCEVFKGLLVPMFVNEAKTRCDFEGMDKALKARTEGAMADRV